jgi:hypothetical protein
MSQNQTRPTARQLAYLKTLAQRTGQTFAYPRTARQASAEIARLRATRPDTPAERTREIKQTRADIQQLGDDCAVRPHELRGYGSSATWSQRT